MSGPTLYVAAETLGRHVLSYTEATDEQILQDPAVVEAIEQARAEGVAEGAREAVKIMCATEPQRIEPVTAFLLAHLNPNAEAETRPADPTPMRVPSGVAQALIRDDSDETHPAPERKR